MECPHERDAPQASFTTLAAAGRRAVAVSTRCTLSLWFLNKISLTAN